MHLARDEDGRYVNHPTERAGEWSQNGIPTRREDILYFLDRCAGNGIDRIYTSIVPGYTRHPAYPEPGGMPDAMEFLVDSAHSRGIQVHPYLAVFMLPNAVKPTHPLALRAEEFTERTRDGSPAFYGGGDHSSGRVFSYGFSAVRRLIAETFESLAKSYPVDGVMLDYIRYPDRPHDDNDTTLLGYAEPIVRAFHSNAGLDPVKIPNNDSTWVRYRADYVTQTIREVRQALPLREGKPLEISVCTGGNLMFDVHRLLRDWRSWVVQGVADTLCPMLYHKPEQVGRETRAIRQALEDATGYSLYSALCVKYEVLPTAALFRQGYAEAMDAGADGVCIYRADGLENTGLWGEVRRLRAL